MMCAEFPRKTFPFKVFYNWEITRYCDYRCSYCIAHDNIKPEVLPNNHILSAWKRLFEKYGFGHIRMSGGEPTAYPGFFDIAEKLTEYFTLELSTNLNFAPEVMVDRLDPDHIFISSSFHPEHTDLSYFLKKAETIRGSGFSVSVTIVTAPPTLDRIVENVKRIVSSGFRVNIQHLSGTYDGRVFPGDYTIEESNTIKAAIIASGNEINNALFSAKHDPISPAGELCRMGQMYARITPSGESFRCCQRESGRLGNIFDPDFRLLDEPEQCYVDLCPCYKAMINNREDSWIKEWKEYPVHPKEKVNNGR